MLFRLNWVLLITFLSCFICRTSSSQRKWVCSSLDRCIFEAVEEKQTFFESQNLCRLSCGRYGALWPIPTLESVLSHNRVYFDPSSVSFDVSKLSDKLKNRFDEIAKIFIGNIWKECKDNCTMANSPRVIVTVSVRSSSFFLDWNTDESYNLTTSLTGSDVTAKITANTIYGARHGLESLSQLITSNVGRGLGIVASARIRDRPVYKHRGLLIDTARNFIPVADIKRTLDGMATSKLNVLHWHIVDSQSFPLEITRVPQLTSFGAYSSKHIYSVSDVQSIISYAKVRGIRVLIEIDGPSHAGNGWQWGPQEGLGNLAVCVNQQPWRSFCIQPPCGQLNPINPNMYEILQHVFEEISGLIPPEETMHMGGDEVFIDCWNATEEIVHALKDKGYDTSTSSFMQLWAEFHAKNLDNWYNVKNWFSQNDRNKNPVILWSSHLTEPEVIERYLPKENYIIHTWVESSKPLNDELMRKGYKIIQSTKDAWYLDHGFWGSTNYYNWKRVYQNRLARNPLALGGEVCMWGEYVDENSLDSRVWPRTGAAAERLWADPNISPAMAETRFYRYRERLISRGLSPDAVTPKWCILHEGECS